MIDDIRFRLGKESPDNFERICCDLLRAAFNEYANIEPGYNALGKTTKGTPDAHVLRADGKYIAFQFTTQQQDVVAKIIKDIAKLNSEKCLFREKIAEVVICINTPVGSEVEKYREETSKNGWHLRIFSLETLSQLLLDHPVICYRYWRIVLPSSSPSNAVERFYDCGDRVKEIREDLGLATSEFIEAINHFSEKYWQKVETKQEECALSVLSKISEVFGVSLDWLKHGKDQKYPTQPLLFYNKEFVFSTLDSISPEGIFFCLEKESLSLFLVVKVTEYYWPTFGVNFGLDFWNWMDDFGYIPRIYHFIDNVYERYGHIVEGRILPSKAFEQLTSEMVHPQKIIETRSFMDIHWSDDIRDIYHHYPISEDYQKTYGTWFVRVQEYFRKYLKKEQDSGQKTK